MGEVGVLEVEVLEVGVLEVGILEVGVLEVEVGVLVVLGASLAVGHGADI